MPWVVYLAATSAVTMVSYLAAMLAEPTVDEMAAKLADLMADYWVALKGVNLVGQLVDC